MIQILNTKEELSAIVEASVLKSIERLKIIQTQTDRREILNTVETAKFLKIAKPTLYGYVNQNKISCFKVKGGKHLYFIKSDLENWLLEGKRPTKQELADDIHTLLKTKKK